MIAYIDIDYPCPFCQSLRIGETDDAGVVAFECSKCKVDFVYIEGHCSLVQYRLDDPNGVYYCLSIEVGVMTKIIFSSSPDVAEMDIPYICPTLRPEEALELTRRLHKLVAFS